ncbi:proline-specific peptidase [Laetiporus sulphureus 93-53]|uniref:Proline-specific peptidase n=1 Tax=Laetiporus sulphureus 93-53 TaxID=1314785 RepID=A0A165I922_9APHY|nr:proline-specific peptidase [Laetiporus sulphureus 93-53]KZT12752.1 proline-specific peptidase [Laetiporus sulphureus 93-53]
MLLLTVINSLHPTLSLALFGFRTPALKMSTAPVTEGLVYFAVPAAHKTCRTFYKIFGDLRAGAPPLVVLHGGPGATHSYMLALADLARAVPVVLYDQLGCGQSTRLQEKAGDGAFWSVQLFVDEFHNLLEHLKIEEYDVLGHSWGAMLAAEIAVRKPGGLRRLVLSSGPASMDLWVQATRNILRQLPEDVQETIYKHESAGTFGSPEYKAAMEEFNKRFVCRLDPIPAEVQETFKQLEEDPTVYGTMEGPSEFTITGTLKTWNIIPSLPKISVPTLLTNGGLDEAQDIVIEPFFAAIDKVKWRTFARSAHMAHWEEREEFMRVVEDFLTMRFAGEERGEDEKNDEKDVVVEDVDQVSCAERCGFIC